MRVLFFGNNWVGWKIAEWLVEINAQVVGVVVHPPVKQKYTEQIINCFRLDQEYVYEGSQLRDPKVVNSIKALKPNIGLSVLFDYILKPELINLFPAGIINVHPAYLPYNRGQYPNVWSIIEGTPAGATIHYIDNEIDTGDIIARQQVTVEPVDTGKTLYRKLEKTCVDLFINTWPAIVNGTSTRTTQNRTEGSYHCTVDVEKIDRIYMDRQYSAKELIDIIRARTFPPHKGAYFIHEERKIYLRLQLLDEKELNGK